MIRAILFDFGGTLDSDGIHWSEKFFDLYQKVGVGVDKVTYEKAYVAGEKRMARHPVAPSDSLHSTLRQQVTFQFEYLVQNGAISSGVAASLASRIAEEAYADVKQSIARVKPMLSTLSKTYQLGLVSNFAGNLVTVARELEIESLFQVIIDSAVVGVSKPDLQIFALAIKQLKIQGGEAVMVGDSYDRDIEPAKALDIRTVFLHSRSWKEPESTAKADYTIKSILELPQALKTLSSRSSETARRR